MAAKQIQDPVVDARVLSLRCRGFNRASRLAAVGWTLARLQDHREKPRGFLAREGTPSTLETTVG